MRKIGSLCMALAISAVGAMAQSHVHPEAYQIDKKDVKRAQTLIDTPLTAPPVVPNPAPGAQWFPEASLGLFMHWGIHSVVGAQPSWDMITGYRYGGRVAPPERYYALAERFNPQQYDPNKFLKAAKEAGFTYAVLTTRHHDGYALWPSKYGIGTKQYMNGRDLLKDYVEACRANGLKVGFYYSPRDWHYPGLMHPREFDVATRDSLPPITDSIANRKAFEQFLGYVMAQLEELLTDYGKIDLLWFDGMSWRGESEMYTEQIYAWVRSLQPDIVINDRWSNIINPEHQGGSGISFGDFNTQFECTLPTHIPSQWWDHCDIWTDGETSGWGYDPKGRFRPVSWFLRHLATTRSMGGNFLINAGPNPNGDMHPNYYTTVDSITRWMQHSRESVIGAGPTPGAQLSNAIITTRDNVWYLHILPELTRKVSVKTDKRPTLVILLRTGEQIPYDYYKGFVTFQLDPAQRTNTDDVVKVIL